ncbi:hypothetical protein QTO34_015016 [Cnephaeus nilssonii]|uniref:Uncharacterized protein n=1 Tax=Cnephaeus nilssonii TaxID=3371016 RepID=A0AA40I4B0_CNENI|nr:hypothetical protein QTO34_015016 [Eptesicus nilssonii]
MYEDPPPPAPPMMLIKHSMGGAIAAHTASSNLAPSLLGLCVTDAVEGTAMLFTAGRTSFVVVLRPSSLWNAIEWSVKSGQVRTVNEKTIETCKEFYPALAWVLPTLNLGFCQPWFHLEDFKTAQIKSDPLPKRGKVLDPRDDSPTFTQWAEDRTLESAQVSTVGQAKECEGITSPESSKSVVEGIIEEDEDDEEGSESPDKRKKEDADLTIGQVQGKSQMQALPQCGHAVHADAPGTGPAAVATFLIRNRVAELP